MYNPDKFENKMIGEKSTEFACGQVLFSLKMSQLNYVVKETPYSVYITVRKTFVKGVTESSNVNIGGDIVENIFDVKKNIKKVENENTELKQMIRDKDKDIGMLQFENENFGVKNEKLDLEIIDLNDKMEAKRKCKRSKINIREKQESSKIMLKKTKSN